MKIQLVQPTTGEYKSNSRSGSYPPLGLVSIATYVKKHNPDTDIEILDGELLTHEEIIQKLDADIVGINANTVTYPQAIKVAKAAKKLNSKIVLGGVYPSALPDLILDKRGDIIDTLVEGYGEKSFLEMTLDNYKWKKHIVDYKPDFNNMPHPDRSFVDMEEYIRIFKTSHPKWNFRATNISTNFGCEWKHKTGGCIFCSRSGTIPYQRKPDLVWQEVRELVEIYGIDYLVDFSDSTLQNIDWFNDLVNSKPKDLNPIWHIFGRMDEINPDTIELMKKLNCRHIFVGIESGDPEVYRSCKKGGGSPKHSIKMAKLLAENNIGLTPSYVIGLPGETEDSLKRTYEHARLIQEIVGFEEIFCCEFIPFPGSAAFKQLGADVLGKSDHIDIMKLKEAWTERKLELSLCTLNDYVHKILDLGEYKITIATNQCQENEHRMQIVLRDSDCHIPSNNIIE
jgi:radical SAM superfamily enzyme YgiQ (UPF0313 family)